MKKACKYCHWATWRNGLYCVLFRRPAEKACDKWLRATGGDDE